MIRKITLSLVLLSGNLVGQAQHLSLSSPSGNIKINIDNFAELMYRVSMDKTIIVSDSPLGFKFKNEPDMGSDLKLIGQQQDEFDESWVPVIKSKHARIRDHYKSLRLSFIEKSGLKRKLNLEFRAYNDGIAFRYQLFSGFKIGDRTITKELTGFNFRENHKAWIADYKSFTSSQEKVFEGKTLAAFTPATKAGLLFLIEVDKTHYAAITEAKIDNYPGFYIGVEREGTLNRYKLITQLSPLPYEDDNGIKARFSDNLYTPWRVIMLGSSPGSLIESEIIQNLNDSCVLKDFSWIKPGISAWLYSRGISECEFYNSCSYGQRWRI